MDSLKKKCWVILCRRISDNFLFGYSTKDDGFYSNRVSVFPENQRNNREDFNQVVNSLRVFIKNKLKSDWNLPPSEYDIFISRVNSGKCPIKVDIKGSILRDKHRPKQRSTAAIVCEFEPKMAKEKV